MDLGWDIGEKEHFLVYEIIPYAFTDAVSVNSSKVTYCGLRFTKNRNEGPEFSARTNGCRRLRSI